MIYVTDGSFEGILTAIFVAYENKEVPESIVSRDFYQMSLDTDVREIDTNEEKSERVYNTVIKKMSHEALETMFMSLVYLSRFTPQTNIGASLEGAEITTFLAPPFK